VSDAETASTLGLHGTRGPAFHLITPENRVAGYLPDWPDAEVTKLATPQSGSQRLGAYLVRVPPGGGTRGVIGDGFEHFLYVLAGSAGVAAGLRNGPHELEADHFAYLPDGRRFAVTSRDGAELVWLKRRYEPLPSGHRPPPVVGPRADIIPDDLAAPGVYRQQLLPADDARRDFTMSIVHFEPGARYPRIQIGGEEKGVFVLDGGGLYHLAGADYHVLSGDFIYAAPYCPQGFASSDEAPAELLVYSDAFRDGF
jgi:(S)-ureidoglycine aminohydrolase